MKYLVQSVFGPTGEVENLWVTAGSAAEACDYVERQGNYNPSVIKSDAGYQKKPVSRKPVYSRMETKPKPAKFGLPYNNQLCFYSVAVYSTTGNKTFYFRTEKGAKNFQAMCKRKANYRISYFKKLPIN